ncbi:MAG: hypothetical protein LBB53_05165 [Prevotellaceae bacterium]|jgi:hypothetical protein|nr:hypothetical protein [Prevotellaceae bacterium]
MQLINKIWFLAAFMAVASIVNAETFEYSASGYKSQELTDDNMFKNDSPFSSSSPFSQRGAQLRYDSPEEQECVESGGTWDSGNDFCTGGGTVDDPCLYVDGCAIGDGLGILLVLSFCYIAFAVRKRNCKKLANAA